MNGWGSDKWSWKDWMTQFGDRWIKTNGRGGDGHCYRMLIKDYYEYMQNHCDEKAVYVFDNKFLERLPELKEFWKIPPHFQGDLFQIAMTAQDRPDDHWFLMVIFCMLKY
jgi:hypothetical protein